MKLIHFIDPREGSLTLVYGCISSGKTRLLVDLYFDALREEIQTQAFLYESEPGRPLSMISDSGSCEAVGVNVPQVLLLNVLADTQIVLVDNAQYFDATFVDVVLRLVDLGKPVVVGMRDSDFRGLPFALFEALYEHAHKKIQVFAPCKSCGREATRTQYLGLDGLPIMAFSKIDASCTAQACCAKCHTVPVVNTEWVTQG